MIVGLLSCHKGFGIKLRHTLFSGLHMALNCGLVKAKFLFDVKGNGGLFLEVLNYLSEFALSFFIKSQCAVVDYFIK